MKKKILDLRQIEEAALRQATVAPTDENYAESLEHRSNEEEKLNIISFFLNGEEFALEVNDAVEVLRPRAFTEVPYTPDFVKGILSVRGEMIIVMDLKKRLFGGGCSDSMSCRILVASIEDLKAGFIVDKLSGVKEVTVSSIDKDVDAEDVPYRGFLKGTIRGAAAIRILDTGKLLDFVVS
ncbi:MAG: chemotaxis protein CheW [Deltaproteobacteria bacterium]|nr:chemotaxis protein CheW [Deltaproteobacteria bacterium]